MKWLIALKNLSENIAVIRSRAFAPNNRSKNKCHAMQWLKCEKSPSTEKLQECKNVKCHCTKWLKNVHFQDLFCCPLSLSSLHPTKPSTPSTKPTTPPPSPSSSPTPPSSSFTSVATISLASAPPTRAETSLARVNRAFNEKYSAPGNLGERKLGKVRFSDEATWQVGVGR